MFSDEFVKYYQTAEFLAVKWATFYQQYTCIAGSSSVKYPAMGLTRYC